jgi:cell division protein FtsB
LEAEKEYYKNEIEKDKKAIQELSTDEGIEKLAREKYYMKKDNEEIYIIEYEDSLKNQKKDE